MYLETGRPMRGAARERLRSFLHACGLDYDEGVSFSVALVEDGQIIATASLDGQTVKCVAVDPGHRGEDLCARLMTELRREAFERGVERLMLFTKPENLPLFRELGFHRVVQGGDCLLMEDRSNGLSRFLEELSGPKACVGGAGAIVANCNPFTLGHRYLVERAAARCDALHMFILSEARGPFPPEVRLALARKACADLKNVYVHPTGPYMVSSATFPDYFIRDKARVDEIRCDLDVRLFGERIAPALNIKWRFVGTEPLCPVTNAYNERLKAQLPRWGVQVVELDRMELNGAPVSASRVRALFDAGKLSELRSLVPECTYQYLSSLKS